MAQCSRIREGSDSYVVTGQKEWWELEKRGGSEVGRARWRSSKI